MLLISAALFPIECSSEHSMPQSMPTEYLLHILCLRACQWHISERFTFYVQHHQPTSTKLRPYSSKQGLRRYLHEVGKLERHLHGTRTSRATKESSKQASLLIIQPTARVEAGLAALAPVYILSNRVSGLAEKH